MTQIQPVTYTPHVWANAGTEGAFPLNAARANEIEKGIKDAADTVNLILPELELAREEPSLLCCGLWPGRKIDDIPEIQGELDTYGSVPAFLTARAKARDKSFLNIGDYTEIQHSGSIGKRVNRIWDFWPYYNCAYPEPLGGHIVMGPDEVWPATIVWNTTNDNNGTASQPFPYLPSNLHKQELQTILPTFPVEWQNVMLPYQTLLEKRYSSSGKLSASTGWDWTNLGKIWSPSETEVYGQCVWGTPGWSVGMDCQFAYFKATRNRIRTLDGTRAGWWLRSVYGSSSARACGVGGGGCAGRASCSGAAVRALPCFLVGA